MKTSSPQYKKDFNKGDFVSYTVDGKFRRRGIIVCKGKVYYDIYDGKQSARKTSTELQKLAIKKYKELTPKELARFASLIASWKRAQVDLIGYDEKFLHIKYFNVIYFVPRTIIRTANKGNFDYLFVKQYEVQTKTKKRESRNA